MKVKARRVADIHPKAAWKCGSEGEFTRSLTRIEFSLFGIQQPGIMLVYGVKQAFLP